MNQTYTTPEERIQILSLYKELREKRPEIASEKQYLQTKQILQKIAPKKFKRDIFGLNPIVRFLQTAIYAVEHIDLRQDSIKACLLMPFVDTEEDLKQIEPTTGPDVRRILHGLIRIKELYRKNPAVENENFRNLLVSFAEDMRVVLIMIANRTNLMRQIRDVKNTEARKRTAEEAAYLYAPLAHKLGLYQVKSELEDLSLKYLNPDAYYLIKERLSATKKTRDAYMENFMRPIEKLLKDNGLKFHIKGRTKSIHSIWQKMQKQNCQFEAVYDLFAIRIILDSPLDKEKLQCWQAYSLITDMYRPNPKRLRDWLSIPKSNGYECLHITVLGPENKWVEVQIRTERMDEIAEHGLAAHWRYKGIKAEQSGVDSWLANIRASLEAADTGVQTMDQFRSELKTEEVYVFTPKGDLHKLPKGATVLDFAYSIHTNVGSHCVGAKIGGKNTSMRHVLASGDQVEILTMNNQTPKIGWLDYAVTSRAKAKIRQSVKENETKQTAIVKEQMERTFRNHKIELQETILSLTIKKLGYKDVGNFFMAISEGTLNLEQVMEAYLYQQKREQGLLERTETHSAEEYTPLTTVKSNDDVLIIDQNLRGVDFTLAKCCNPVYGDEVFGFVTSGKGIKIHRTNCPNAHILHEKFGYRVVKARWSGNDNSGLYPIVLRIVGNDDLGVVNNISSVISKEEKINMRSFSIDTHDGLFSGSLTIMISNLERLDSILKKLKGIKGVKSVSRA